MPGKHAGSSDTDGHGGQVASHGSQRNKA